MDWMRATKRRGICASEDREEGELSSPGSEMDGGKEEKERGREFVS